MARRGRNQEPALFDEAFETLKSTPVWLGPVFAVTIFVLLYYIIPFLIPATEGGFGVGIMAQTFLPMFGWLFALVILAAWVAAEVHRFTNKRLLDRQTGSDNIRNLTWREFEHLIGEYYRRHGYIAEVVGGASGDGGVDIVLNGHGETVLVQCKQWKAWKVGVSVVRELLGVVVSRGATKGIIVTSGRFTREAVSFADNSAEIELVDGGQLTDMIRSVQGMAASLPATRQMTAVPLPPPLAPSTPACPKCGNRMVLRTATRGVTAGSNFWGCYRYPACHGTRSIVP